MKKVAVSEFKASLSRYLSAVKAGDELLVTERGRPVARIVPASPTEAMTERLARLARSGLIRPGTGKIRGELLRPPLGRRPSGALAALLAERSGDR